jgi:NADP-dependent 3-hydroxy acid dehydrogenase YdfG
MNSIFSCIGKVALITGGGTGIGLGIAKALIDSGAKVILVGRREEVLKKACYELGDQSQWISGDIKDLAKDPSFPKQCGRH